ncbi:DUF4153 domain-containing protein [Nonlabens ulvanivorans]|uniref:Uncharacterized protein DUF4173 n=3 Tax=Nonlabens ulvanivorans TaxID=906888 RepID=A0A084JZG8_NONUL|nr:DUF4153 domain-containing protein [Nonlabens ulvanivorans]KEZ94352.1 hypothetical protein IL45_01660 [Nonlabens ulvanivorans]PRX12242.1 uncharacterized protein DUF4173 [Nonlabens ulvanivorans]WOI21605.1 DUF4153 domain-containing protein [Nonlabens ulvanivorans]
MKKTIVIILGGITFATLFYNHFLGLNTAVYALFLIIALAVMNTRSLLKPTIIASAAGMIASSIAIIMHGSGMAVMCYFLSVFLFIGMVASSQASIYTSWFNGLYNLFFGMFHDFIFNIQKIKEEPTSTYAVSQIIKITVIPILLIILFSYLYSLANPVFAEWLAFIDLSFIDGLWFFTAILGGFIMGNIAQPNAIDPLTENDIKTDNFLKSKELENPEIEKAKNELQLGTFSISALNILLVIVLITELMFILNIKDFAASELSDAVHSGVYASIVSIILAVVIIAIFFRGSINFIRENGTLKTLTFIWIGLNSLLIASIFTKTYLYIDQYGLSMKRIGVVVYLTLCLIGLFTTFLKVQHQLNFVYLWRRNLAVSFVIISIFSLFNWSAIVTDYNLNNDFVDHKQLERLLPQNALILKKHGLYDDAQQLNNSLGYSSARYWEEHFTNRQWQDFNYIAYQIKKENNQDAQSNP